MRGFPFAPVVLALGCGPAEPALMPAPPPKAPVVVAATASAPAPAPAAASAAAPASASAPVAEPAPAAPSGPRLYAVEGIPWIYPTPEKKGERYLGYIRVGESVALKKPEPVRGAGCARGFWAIEPRGYVCNDPLVSREPLPEVRPAFDATLPAAGPFPYKYAISNGAPMYNRVPTPREQARIERLLGPAGKFEPLSKFLSAHEDLAQTEPITPTDPLPAFLEGGKMVRPGRFDLVRQNIPHGSMLSYTKAFSAEGRTFLLSVDLTVVPADRVRSFRPSSFHGVRLGDDVALPLAWFRKSPRAKWRRLDGGAMERTGTSFPARSYAMLTGHTAEVAGATYLETKEREGGQPVWVEQSDATVVEPRQKLPFGVREGTKWVHVRITQGTLVAYEGLKPVFATLISPGSGGVPVKGIDNVKASTTPTGTFYVTFKDKAATMSPEKGEDRSFWIADVPHTQYFNPPFALHAAYWHERFGEPTSAGCVNLSPIDAETLFHWSDPPVPAGWQGASGAGAPENGPTTAVVISR
ncbi:L,D-transpeptidase [Polyangium jinanense]|uniref:L,D-transpeptidase n=1 Tax=Polyangium jinanense TaxID=2829994 RepID=A0A9X3X4B1_9BACT|nr:L,D-transpeptidase [Polyangium jinanense]MDC3959080.1 L,D-transpeptidase [Polyangium jinanense]MDC3983997.1 L,D-transpeptidase [Polyangium jinanense]